MGMERVTELHTKILESVGLSQYSSSTPSSWILLLVGVAATLVVISVVQLLVSRKSLNLPPGPRNWPIIGALFEMEPQLRKLIKLEPQLHKVLDRFANRYGPIVYFRLGVQNIVVVSTAEAAEELLRHKDADFADREAKMTRSSRKYAAFDGVIFPFANYDDELKLHRKLFVSELFTVAKIKTYETLRTQEVAAMVENVFCGIHHGGKGDEYNDIAIVSSAAAPAMVDVRAVTEAVPRNIMFMLAVGKRFDSLPPKDELREFPVIVDEIMKIVMEINIVDFFPWLIWLDPQGLISRMKAFEKRQTRYYERILERNKRAMMLQRESRTDLNGDADEASKNSFVQILLRAQQEGTKLSDVGIMASVMSVLTGGIDTTGSQMEWVLLHLARHPNVLQRLQDEIDVVVGKERPLEEADLPALPLLNAVVLETMRLSGVVPYSFPHVNAKPATLCGYNIPAKTAVFLNMYSIGRDPKRWKDPLQFNPDRFMVGGTDPAFSPEAIRANGNYFHLLPFSSGRRVCPGYNVAILVLLRTVGTLVHAFDWSPPPGCSPEELSIEEEGSIILHPTPKLFLVPTPRLSSHVYMSNLV
ncbi:unnamed protein product [Calypogeia fissa]